MWHLIDSSGKDVPGNVSHHTSIVYGDKMFVFGGSKDNDHDSSQCLYSLDLKSFKWELLNSVKNAYNILYIY